jgi:hypothetical protein
MNASGAKTMNYRRRALDLRRVAADMSDVDSQAIVLSMADDYMRLAEALERIGPPAGVRAREARRSENPSPSV